MMDMHHYHMYYEHMYCSGFCGVRFSKDLMDKLSRGRIHDHVLLAHVPGSEAAKVQSDTAHTR